MEPRLREPRLRASAEQSLTLLEFMENHGDLAKPQPGSQGRLMSNRLWEELTQLLNSIGGGVPKTTEKWKKVWADWKTKTKKKAIIIKRHTTGTGGGPSNGLTLSAPEERVLAILGVYAVEGHPDIEELGFNRRPVSPISSPVHGEDRLHETITIQAEVYEPLQGIAPTPQQPAAPPQHPAAPPPHPAAPPQRPAAPPQHPASPRRQRHRELEQSPHSSAPTTPQRRNVRRRRETPFERACHEFSNIERRRLQMEQEREKWLHQREMQRLQLESERLKILEKNNELLLSLLEVNKNILNVLGV